MSCLLSMMMNVRNGEHLDCRYTDVYGDDDGDCGFLSDGNGEDDDD